MVVAEGFAFVEEFYSAGVVCLGLVRCDAAEVSNFQFAFCDIESRKFYRVCGAFVLHNQDIRVKACCICLAGVAGGLALGGEAIAVVAVPRLRSVAIVIYVFIVVCCKSNGRASSMGVWGMGPPTAPVSAHKE